MTDLLAALFALLPVFAAFAAWYLGADYWPSAVHYHLAVFAGGAAGTLMILSSSMSGRQTRAAMRLIAYSFLPLIAVGAVWPYVWLFDAARRYALDELQGGRLAPGTAVWSRTIDIYAHYIRHAEFHSVSAGLFILVVGLIVLNMSGARKMWRTLFPKTRRQEEGPWTATFLESEKIRQLTANDTGLPIGLIRDRILRYEPALRVWPKGHHFVIAGTRAGKFVSAGKPAVLDHPGSIVALDLKGEIFTACHAHRSQTRRQVVLDPYRILEQTSAKFDPFAYLRPDQLHRDLGTFVDGCIKPTTGEFQWVTNGCVDITRAAVESTMIEDTGDDRFLRVVDKLLAADRLDKFENWANQTSVAEGRIADAAANLLDLSDRQRGSILDELRQNLVWAQNPMLRAVLAGNDFSFDDVVAGTIDLYLVVPPDALREASGFMRLLMNLALGAFLRRGVERDAPDCLFVYDEFTRLGRLDKIIDVATIAAGYNVTALFFAQNLDSVREVYGNSTMTLIGSCATTRVFGLGAGDTGTAKWLAETMGTATARTETRQDAKTTAGETGVPLLDAAEILQLPADEQIILFRGHPPARTKLIISHEHPFYRDRMPQRNV